MTEVLFRFLIGGVIVSLFAMLGDVLRPKSFAGLFGAAPSIALATIGFAIAKDGSAYVALEARSMIVGALAFFIYAWAACWLLLHRKARSPVITLALLPVWFAVSFGLWFGLLR